MGAFGEVGGLGEAAEAEGGDLEVFEDLEEGREVEESAVWFVCVFDLVGLEAGLAPEPTEFEFEFEPTPSSIQSLSSSTHFAQPPLSDPLLAQMVGCPMLGN